MNYQCAECLKDFTKGELRWIRLGIREVAVCPDCQGPCHEQGETEQVEASVVKSTIKTAGREIGGVLVSSEKKVNPFYFFGRAGVLLGVFFCTYLLVKEPLFENMVEHPVARLFHLPNLGFHEAGHFLFRPFGELMMFLGGSLNQVLIPLICMFSFWWYNRDTFSAAVMFWWAGQSMLDVAPYIGDARDLEMVLLGGKTGKETSGHDWENILDRLNMLHLDDTIAQWTFVIGKGILIAACIWALISLILQARRLDLKA